MIAMQYTIRLAGDYDYARVRERVERRRPLFDGLDGLVHKSYLFSESDRIYAPFYVWKCEDAAREFLTGDLFQDLVETFGRPRVRCWGVLAFGGSARGGHPTVAVKELDSVAAEENLSRLVGRERERHDAAMETPGLCFHLAGLDPDRWQLMRYSAWRDPGAVRKCDTDAVECYQILQLCRPEAVG